LETASVMCKKAVEGLDALCLEVTFGKAALIKTREHADRLATLMVRLLQLHSIGLRQKIFVCSI